MIENLWLESQNNQFSLWKKYMYIFAPLLLQTAAVDNARRWVNSKHNRQTQSERTSSTHTANSRLISF